MTLRIELWHIRYRLPGRPGASVPARLEAARGAALEDCVAAVGRELGADPTVYVVRRVRSAWAVNVAGVAADRALARAWGERLARSIVRAVAGPDVARFSDAATYAAEFLAAAGRGVAAADWRFAPLRDFLRPDLGQTAAAVLRGHRDQLPAVLRALYRTGAAAAVLAALPRASAFELWCDGLLGGPTPDPAAERPLFAAAVRLAADLGWLTASPAAGDWFRDYAATGPAPSDWGSRASLTGGVVRALRFLAARGWVDPRQAPGHSAADLLAVTGRSDWLDTAQLAERLAAVGRTTAAPPARPVPAPRLAAMRDAVRRATGGCQLPDPADPAGPANALAVFAAVADAHPHWSTDPLLRRLVDAEVRAEPAHPFSGAVELVRTAADDHRRPHPVAAGPDVEAPATAPGAVARRTGRAGPAWFESPAAGSALLFRAVLDTRLPALCRRHGVPSADPAVGLPALLVALGLRWAGCDAGPAPDPGLAALAGLDRPLAAADLAAVWAGVPPERLKAFRSALLGMAAGRRMIAGGAVLRAAVVEAAGGPALVGGDDEARVWPLAERLAGRDPAAVLAQWEEEWRAAVGPAGAVAAVPSAGAAAVIAAYPAGLLGVPDADLTVGLAADLLLRVWAGWLRRFERAGSGYLLDHLVRRPGRVFRADRGWLVELAARPLDPVLRLAGYTDPVEGVPWLGGDPIRFALRGE